MALVRLVTGFFMIYHGWEVFSAAKMETYLQWDMFWEGTAGQFQVYAGKIAELLAGILLFTGFLTRIASLIMVFTMGYIAFFVGNGRVWYEDQHPFLFVLLGLVFLFAGPGSWSIDGWIQKKGAVHAR